jgi:hypothetical protein
VHDWRRNGPIQGFVGHAADQDWYRFELVEGGAAALAQEDAGRAAGEATGAPAPEAAPPARADETPQVALRIELSGERDVVARSDPRQRRRIRRGAAVYAAERKTLITFGYKPDGIRLALPMPGFDRAVTGRYFSVYTRC